MDLTTELVTLGLVLVGYFANQLWHEWRHRRKMRAQDGEYDRRIADLRAELAGDPHDHDCSLHFCWREPDPAPLVPLFTFTLDDEERLEALAEGARQDWLNERDGEEGR